MGDAILAFFGAPQAHEDDPQRAILAGLAIVEAIEPLRERVRRLYGLDFDVRVGINTGLVVVGDFGARDRFEYTAMGDAINLAARVEQTAAPGTVVVAGATHRLTAPVFEFEALGEIAVRGRAGREPVYRALRARPATARPCDIAGLGSPLVAREGEMAILRRAYEELRQGRGQIVLIVAEPGLGKSRLIDELRRHWEEDERRVGATAETEAAGEPARVAWLENRLVSYEAPQPYGAVQQRLRRVFGIERRDAT